MPWRNTQFGKIVATHSLPDEMLGEPAHCREFPCLTGTREAQAPEVRSPPVMQGIVDRPPVGNTAPVQKRRALKQVAPVGGDGVFGKSPLQLKPGHEGLDRLKQTMREAFFSIANHIHRVANRSNRDLASTRSDASVAAMHPQGERENTIKPTDLRGILKYVPMFRDHIFVIALDGSVVAHENFPNVLLDIAVLRSLNIRIVLVHGIGEQLKTLARERDIPISDAHGEGKTDPATLGLAAEASALVSLSVMQGLTRNKLRCAISNGVRSKEAGILGGEEQLHTGNVDKLDLPLFHRLLESDTVPVVTPIAFNREGVSLRLNSDALSVELAKQLNASKLIFLTTEDGLRIDGQARANLPVEELAEIVERRETALPDRLRSKARHAVGAVKAGTPRAHILDGRLFGALLNEIFDKVGIGTMVHGNEYQSIRRATPADAQAIHEITRSGVRAQTLRERPIEAIRDSIGDYLVYEIDGGIVGCAVLTAHPEAAAAEIGSVYVQPFYQNKGVGRKLVEFACAKSKHEGVRKVFAMTTQAAPFFTRVCGFEETRSDQLPEERRKTYDREGRNSRVLVRNLDRE